MSKLKFDRDELRIFDSIRSYKSKAVDDLEGLDSPNKPDLYTVDTKEICEKSYNEIMRIAERIRSESVSNSRDSEPEDIRGVHRIVSVLLRRPKEEHQDIGLWLKWMEKQFGRQLYGDPEALKLWKSYNQCFVRAYLKLKSDRLK